MPDKEWIKTLEDGRIVKFTNQELPEDEAFITLQVAGNKVVYSIILTKVKNPLSCEEIEDHFEGELQRSSTPQLGHGPTDAPIPSDPLPNAQTRSYFRLVASRAFTETKAFWNDHRTFVSLAVPTSGLVLRVIIRGRSQLNGWQEVMLFCLVGFVVSWLGSYCINLIRVPGILYREQARTAAEQTAALINLREENSTLNSALSQPKISRQEERRRQLVSDKLKQFTKEGKAVLKYIFDHGTISNLALDAESGFRQAVINQAVVEAITGDLLKPIGEGLAVNPEFKSAIAFILDNEDIWAS